MSARPRRLKTLRERHEGTDYERGRRQLPDMLGGGVDLRAPDKTLRGRSGGSRAPGLRRRCLAGRCIGPARLLALEPNPSPVLRPEVPSGALGSLPLDRSLPESFPPDAGTGRRRGRIELSRRYALQGLSLRDRIILAGETGPRSVAGTIEKVLETPRA